jgi:hypothetical protein
MDLLNIIPLELKEILFIEITDHEDLLQVYDSGVFNDIFNNVQSWTRKLINNFPMLHPGLFSIPSTVTSRLVKYNIMVDAFAVAHDVIDDLDGALKYGIESQEVKDNIINNPEDILFLSTSRNNGSMNITDFEFLQLSPSTLEAINRAFLKSYSDVIIEIGKKGANITSEKREYIIKVSLPEIDPEFKIMETVTSKTLISYYFIAMSCNLYISL